MWVHITNSGNGIIDGDDDSSQQAFVGPQG